jgi:protein-glutamine gamma-glutamyltransferase
MIYISNKLVDPNNLLQIYLQDKLKTSVVKKMATSHIHYAYKNLEELKFELSMRINIVNSSKALFNSDFSFRTFRKSKCNEKFWKRTNDGGFLLKNHILPSDALNDIFSNGFEYGTECATAIIIIYYKALLEVFGSDDFNNIFTSIHLMNWHYLNKQIGIASYIIQGPSLPGDCVYFKNPDVNPLTPEWQGENAIDLDNDTYYGHGLGIKTAEEMIVALNDNRKNNSTESAFLTNSVTRPSFKQLSKIFTEVKKI